MTDRPFGVNMTVFPTISAPPYGARGRKALDGGDPNGGIISAGLVVGLIDDVPTCQALIQRMVRECRERLALTLSCLG
jgi:nitronate monooxygenase